MKKQLAIFVDFVDFFKLHQLVSVVCICENKKMYLLLPPRATRLLGNKDCGPFSCIRSLSCGSCDLEHKLKVCTEEEDMVCCPDS